MAIKITENGTVNYENENDVNRTLFPNEPNTKEITKKLSIIENKLSFFLQIPVIGQINIADGTSGVTYTTIPISNVLPSGYTAFYASVCLDKYQLPYFSTSGDANTWVNTLNNNRIEIANKASAWTNYTYYAVLFCVKN